MKLTTYTARYTNALHMPCNEPPIYTGQPCGNLIGLLPLGTWPVAAPGQTLERADGGDPWEHAIFQTPSGRRVLVTRDEQQAELRVVVVMDSSGNDTTKVFSNCQTLPVEFLDKGDPDPESTDAAEARLVEEDLHLIEESLR